MRESWFANVCPKWKEALGSDEFVRREHSYCTDLRQFKSLLGMIFLTFYRSSTLGYVFEFDCENLRFITIIRYSFIL